MQRDDRRELVRLAAIAAIGGAILWWGTSGFSAFTAETARRQAAEQNPHPLPAVTLQNQQGRIAGLNQFAGKVVLVEFIYTRCLTVCSALGATFGQLRAAIDDAGLADHIALVSLSFDPDHDGPSQLTAYADRFGGADRVWTFARPRSHADTQALLDAAGVIVIPDGAGGFVHNAAIHVIDRQGRLIRIFDIDAWPEALALARRRM